MDENSLKVLLRTRILEAVRSVKPPGKWKIVVVDKHSLKLISSVLKLYDLLEEDVSSMINHLLASYTYIIHSYDNGDIASQIQNPKT
ncbi:Syntaxin-binding protein 2 [Zancudomyces culisetae]|uniref:Syntaxin-binding protein 2 n=1 Tax=Zancudomyces culisetae TaxID=1213189 RepID=A0A1R1PCH6_ZANCU|nr:Syntaxin-binding protein 2 [Zancudomyces culisetae]|eukprot:OMH78552.1 Syntaxin-binding protein 2 [Zancudomyces culisetae]